MKAITIDTIMQAVIDHGDGGKTHPRLYEIYTSLVKHLYRHPCLPTRRATMTQIS